VEHVDSSSGAVGTAVDHAVEELAAVIAAEISHVGEIFCGDFDAPLEARPD
jgi:hypothetical protein